MPWSAKEFADAQRFRIVVWQVGGCEVVILIPVGTWTGRALRRGSRLLPNVSLLYFEDSKMSHRRQIRAQS